MNPAEQSRAFDALTTAIRALQSADDASFDACVPNLPGAYALAKQALMHALFNCDHARAVAWFGNGGNDANR